MQSLLAAITMYRPSTCTWHPPSFGWFCRSGPDSSCRRVVKSNLRQVKLLLNIDPASTTSTFPQNAKDRNLLGRMRKRWRMQHRQHGKPQHSHPLLLVLIAISIIAAQPALGLR